MVKGQVQKNEGRNEDGLNGGGNEKILMEVDAFHQLNPGSQTGHLQLCLVITTFRIKIESQVILEACTFH